MSSSQQSGAGRKVVPAHVLQRKNYAWHAHDVREVMAVLDLDENGLNESLIEKQRLLFGENTFTETPPPSLIFKVFEQLRSPLAFVLLIAFGVTAALQEYVDAGVILFALLIAVAVGVLQEGKASRAFKKLSDSQVKTATVIRSGKRHEILAIEIVPGDIVIIQSGMHVPADIRLLRSKKLAINEAPLTGEWRAVDKSIEPISVGTPLSEQSNMAFMGTFVAEGEGIGVAIATGDSTEIGKLAVAVQEIEETQTPLQHEMEQVSRIMLYIITTVVVAIFLVGIWQGLSLHDMLLMSIAIAVASVPEGLPAAVTIILAVGMEALLKRGGLVRNLLAAETLGSTTYVLTDKTGTLTEAKMSVTSVMLSGENKKRAAWKNDQMIKELFDISLCATDAFVDEKEESEKTVVLRGDSVEKAILGAALSLGINPDDKSLRADRVDHLSFTSENRFAAGLSPYQQAYRLCCNGAPGDILNASTTIQNETGTQPLTETTRLKITDQISAETKRGKRLIAVGYRDVDVNEIPDDDTDTATVLSDLTFVGVIVLDDPVREGVRDAISGVRSAGANILLITGDNPDTALSVAQEVGIATSATRVMTGDEISQLSDDELLHAIKTDVQVFARVLPKQKMRIAMILQQKGEIVAMTGDGINDAPALQRANIGVAIGSGTEVAKEASDLVLVNDTFATIYAAIEEGRRIISNLRKIIGYLLSTSLSEVVLVGAAVLVGAPPPILPAQILWANIIEEGLMSVAFAFEPGEDGAMKRKPQDIHEQGVLSREMLTFMATVITILSTLTLALYFYLRSLNISIEELRSAMFVSIALDSLFMSFAFRSLTTPIWKISLRTNLFFVGSFLLSAALLTLALTVPFMQNILSYQPLPLYDVMLVLGFSLASLLTIELSKWLFFERQK